MKMSQCKYGYKLWSTAGVNIISSSDWWGELSQNHKLQSKEFSMKLGMDRYQNVAQNKLISKIKNNTPKIIFIMLQVKFVIKM